MYARILYISQDFVVSLIILREFSEISLPPTYTHTHAYTQRLYQSMFQCFMGASNDLFLCIINE